jgi:hypothetical protein
MKYDKYKILCIIIIIFIICYSLLKKNIKVQKYLPNIYSNSKKLKNKFKFFSDDYTIKNENGIVLVENILSEDYYNYLKKQFDNKKYSSSNIFFRKGSGVNFMDLHEDKNLNGFLELYYSNNLLDLLSDIFEKNIQRTPLSDVNACSLLIYDNPGDHIDWHKDYSGYWGDRYVLLLSIINENENKTCCSHNEFQYEYEGKIHSLKLKPNNMLIFKGSEILHRSTEIKNNERRILLSMTFGDICQPDSNIIYDIYESIKNMILYK